MEHARDFPGREAGRNREPEGRAERNEGRARTIVETLNGDAEAVAALVIHLLDRLRIARRLSHESSIEMCPE